MARLLVLQWHAGHGVLHVRVANPQMMCICPADLAGKAESVSSGQGWRTRGWMTFFLVCVPRQLVTSAIMGRGVSCAMVSQWK